MKKFDVKLESIKGVQNFVKQSAKAKGDVTLKSGRYVIDGKSIMGVFSLGFEDDVTLEIEEEDAHLFDDIKGMVITEL
jgi:phosphotransferase system HPr-like phosphotransfer protein